VNGNPEQGPIAGVTPHLAIADGRAGEAIDWYVRAFGAEERLRMPHDDGKRLMHAHLVINGGSLMLVDDFPEYSGRRVGVPEGVWMHLQVDDADRWFARAVEAGGEPTMPLSDTFWGDRYGQLRDPFGHRWSIGSAINKGEGA
jgi:PhnB protein